MIVLRPVILVREIPPNTAKLRSQLPSIRSLISEQPHCDEAKILQYLQQGVFGCYYPDPGLARDVLVPGKKVDSYLPAEALAHPGCSTAIEPSGVLTDGVW